MATRQTCGHGCRPRPNQQQPEQGQQEHQEAKAIVIVLKLVEPAQAGAEEVSCFLLLSDRSIEIRSMTRGLVECRGADRTGVLADLKGEVYQRYDHTNRGDEFADIPKILECHLKRPLTARRSAAKPAARDRSERPRFDAKHYHGSTGARYGPVSSSALEGGTLCSESS